MENSFRKSIPNTPGSNNSNKRKVIFFLLNRYVLVSILAILWLIFFDQFDFRSQIKLRSKINYLEEQKSNYQREIEKLSSERALMDSDPTELERIAREHFLMKKSNEDVYIIIPDSSR